MAAGDDVVVWTHSKDSDKVIRSFKQHVSTEDKNYPQPHGLG